MIFILSPLFNFVFDFVFQNLDEKVNKYSPDTITCYYSLKKIYHCYLIYIIKGAYIIEHMMNFYSKRFGHHSTINL